MKFILGKKLEMTQMWQGDKVVAVTRVQAGPCLIVQIKDENKDGYKAAQLGFGEKKEKNIKKPQKGHLKKVKSNLRYLREFRCDDLSKDLKVGDMVDAGTFEPGDKIKITGVSKGKGFQGVVKRHGFGGAPKSHGTKDQVRMPGSIGATGPAHVFKGQKMPGRMGGEKTTISNLEIAEVDKENNILLIKGAVPGARNGLLLIFGEGELKAVSPKQESKEENGDKNKEKDVEKKKEDSKAEDKQGDKAEEKK